MSPLTALHYYDAVTNSYPSLIFCHRRLQAYLSRLMFMHDMQHEIQSLPR